MKKYPDLIFKLYDRLDITDLINSGCQLIRENYYQVGIDRKEVGKIVTDFIKKCMLSSNNREEVINTISSYFTIIKDDK